MTKEELRLYNLKETKETKQISLVAGCPVYRIIGYENTLVSRWDFYRNIVLPENVWSISKAGFDGIYQLHVSQEMLTLNKDSVLWAAKQLELQIFLKKELDDQPVRDAV